MSDTLRFEVYALRYGTHPDRPASLNFLGADPHDGPMSLDYFVWAIRGGGRTIIVDTGFNRAVAEKRQRTILTPPDALLRRIGVEASEVADVVVTHLHFDHAGNLRMFPNARLHIQDAEMAFCTGRCMCHAHFRAPMEADDAVAAVRALYAGRMRFHDGTAEIAPGITVHLIGGHSGGLQCVRVPTARGNVVLASDATHFWANIRDRRPFPIIVDLPRMFAGYETLERLADGPDHIIPGHDPLVRTRFAPVPGHPDIVRVDLPPVA
jgi:glyoxylase-like metal-dependent hydrolase (beta-lactamase superfamily II)